MPQPLREANLAPRWWPASATNTSDPLGLGLGSLTLALTLTLTLARTLTRTLTLTLTQAQLLEMIDAAEHEWEDWHGPLE